MLIKVKKEKNFDQEVVVLHNGEIKLKLKKFLSRGEMQAILAVVKDNNDLVSRDINKDLLVLKFCTDIENDLDDLELIDYLYDNNIMEEITSKIRNYDDINKYIDKMETVENTVKLIGDKIIEGIDKFTNMDLGEAETNLKNLLSQIKEVGGDNAEIVEKVLPNIIKEVTNPKVEK